MMVLAKSLESRRSRSPTSNLVRAADNLKEKKKTQMAISGSPVARESLSSIYKRVLGMGLTGGLTRKSSFCKTQIQPYEEGKKGKDRNDVIYCGNARSKPEVLPAIMAQLAAPAHLQSTSGHSLPSCMDVFIHPFYAGRQLRAAGYLLPVTVEFSCLMHWP
eukprot:13477477-Ditylum_brightwellii.AAC.1